MCAQLTQNTEIARDFDGSQNFVRMFFGYFGVKFSLEV